MGVDPRNTVKYVGPYGCGPPKRPPFFLQMASSLESFEEVFCGAATTYEHDFSGIFKGPKITPSGEAKIPQVEIRSVTYASNRVRQFQGVPRPPQKDLLVSFKWPNFLNNFGRSFSGLPKPEISFI